MIAEREKSILSTSSTIDQLLARTSVIVPALNEEKNLPHVLPRIPQSVKEILVVDGHSSDNTLEVAMKLHPKVRTVCQQGRGKGNALKCGFSQASGDIIVTMDADGSMRPEEIIRFVEALGGGFDVARGSRFKDGGGTSDMQNHRKYGNWCFIKLTNVLYGARYTDLAYGYNAFWRHCLTEVELQSDGFAIETEMAIKFKKAGLAITELPSYEDARISGKTNLHSFQDGWRILKTILKECEWLKLKEQSQWLFVPIPWIAWMTSTLL
jgi:glycosyltransferase involved in cell wall biosynthesis